jgi:hypothetical protein
VFLAHLKTLNLPELSGRHGVTKEGV